MRIQQTKLNQKSNVHTDKVKPNAYTNKVKSNAYTNKVISKSNAYTDKVKFKKCVYIYLYKHIQKNKKK